MKITLFLLFYFFTSIVKCDQVLLRIKRNSLRKKSLESVTTLAPLYATVNKSRKPKRSNSGSKKSRKKSNQSSPPLTRENSHASIKEPRRNSINEPKYASIKIKRRGSTDEHPYASIEKNRRGSIGETLYASIKGPRRGSSDENLYVSMQGSRRGSSDEDSYVSMNGNRPGSVNDPIYTPMNGYRRSSKDEPIYATINDPTCSSMKENIHATLDEPVYVTMRSARVSWRKPTYDNFPESPFIVTTHIIKTRKLYECNDYMFTSHSSAVHYCRCLRSGKIKNIYDKPRGSLYRKQSTYKLKAFVVNGMQFFECGDYAFKNYKDAKRYQALVYNNRKLERLRAPRGGVKTSTYLNGIIWYKQGSKTIFEFGNYAFDNYDAAYKYSRLLATRKSRYSQEYPENCIGESRHKMESFDITLFLGTSTFSYGIWSIVWTSCDYYCFSRNNYDVLKRKLFLEMNMYRKKHKSPELRYNDKLSEAAQKHANKIGALRTIMHSNDTDYVGTTVGITYYMAGSTIVKRWYDEVKNYNFLLSIPKYGTQMFTQMIWRKSLRVGFGVTKFQDLIVVVAKYYPKGNENKKYRSNVLTRR